MGRTIQRKNKDQDAEYISKCVEEYQKAREAVEVFDKRAKEFRDKIIEAIQQYGYADNAGHQWLDIEGVDGVASVKRERRVSRSLDVDRAKKWLDKHDLWDEVKEVIEVLSEDKLVALAWDKRLPEKTLQGMYNESENFALKVVKA